MAKNDPAPGGYENSVTDAEGVEHVWVPGAEERVEIDPGPLMAQKIKDLDEAEARNAAQGHALPPLTTTEG